MRLRSFVAALILLATPSLALADQDSALAAARSRPGVLDASIDDRGNLWVVVKNANISWDQFANYMCDVVRPHKARVFIAHIVDVTSVGRGKKSSEWKQLAAASCAR
ncbi:hypothetical protein CU669_13620 [Paramagnetospirillum kuznetsovii]|uniref:Uncharacterized protein n=1 Tax=Paramagnetospirillum kuznetsovii TaxID=2053833 RepID=A0A364NWI9_9PROT|nr:hypothetical protein [Paramagnetospirillum kuznetsovii]RAU21459.1 hypothetical protein CU669_13620 [Paramagnetospirillum kuznetsovii]